jgi:hypothetical protein
MAAQLIVPAVNTFGAYCSNLDFNTSRLGKIIQDLPLGSASQCPFVETNCPDLGADEWMVASLDVSVVHEYDD